MVIEETLISLINSHYENKAHIDIWIDVPEGQHIDLKTVNIANKYKGKWTHGNYTIHLRDENAGLTEQWLYTWDLSVQKSRRMNLKDIDDEIGVILEDDTKFQYIC